MSDTFTEARFDLSNFMKTQWIATGQTAENLFYENNDDDKLPLYANLTVRFGDRDRAALGKSLFRTIGVVYLQIFVKAGTGTQQVDLLGETLVAAIENQGSVNGIRMRSASYRQIGLDPEDQTYFQAQIRVNFEFDVIR